MNYEIQVIFSGLPNELLAHMGEEEAQGALKVAERSDTVAMVLMDADTKPVGYAVFGKDQGDMMAVYYARSFIPVFGPMMMRQFFNVSEVLGTPLRMHVSSLRDIAVKARMFGASIACEGVDADGIMQGIFSNE